jgi:2-oxoglutarate dehydrogenase E2 component (dihydrolipoamide succinyltransferase)
MNVGTDIRVPDDLAAGSRAQVLRWFKAVGDTVLKDEPLLELETDKVTIEVAAPCSGRLIEITAGPNTDCPAAALLGRIGSEQSAVDGTTTQRMPETAAKASRSTMRNPNILLSPAVRALVHANKIDTSIIQGTGRDGRITAADVKAHLDTRSVVSSPTSSSTKDSEPSQSSIEGSRLVPHSPVRKRIAARMVESLLHTAPHVTSVFEADLGAVLAHRARHRAEFEKRGDQLTLTAYFARACVAAIAAVPESNARWHDDGLELIHHLDLGIATALEDGGLVVPVLRQVERSSLAAIAEQLTALTRRARAGELTRSDVAPGTFTLSNHGVSGSLVATPVVINQPQTAILGIGKLEKRVVVLDQDGIESIAIRPRCYVSLTIDHRAMDGAHANRFLSVFVNTLQQPD